MKFHEKHQINIPRILFLFSGLILLISAILYNEFLLSILVRNYPIDYITITKIRSAQVYFIISGLLLIFISECIRRIKWLSAIMGKAVVTNIFLSIFSVLLPLFILELSLKVFIGPVSVPLNKPKTTTTIFLRDSELGWRLKPNSKDQWGGVEVQINSKGLRGPELNYDKSSRVKRILYLGDSVTFGYGLEHYEQTFPYIIKDILEKNLLHKIETINAGVDGYSEWQEYIYLSKEGVKYKPDLVVISFILNDVTEKFSLKIFGGRDEGYQLWHTAPRLIDNLNKILDKSSIVNFARRIRAHMRFGVDIQLGAQQLSYHHVKWLAYDPDNQSVQKAWEITLENLRKMLDFCKQRHIPAVLIIFPYTFQFDDINTLSTPQTILKRFAFDNKIPVIDLLPILAEDMKVKGTKPEDYFLDEDHLSIEGSKTVAEIIANFLLKEKLI